MYPSSLLLHNVSLLHSQFGSFLSIQSYGQGYVIVCPHYFRFLSSHLYNHSHLFCNAPLPLSLLHVMGISRASYLYQRCLSSLHTYSYQVITGIHTFFSLNSTTVSFHENIRLVISYLHHQTVILRNEYKRSWGSKRKCVMCRLKTKKEYFICGKVQITSKCEK